MIGILDWGIGGFGFYRALRREAPDARVLYFSDSGFTPYGKVPAVKLARRVREVLAYMHAQGASQVVIACNAASTVLPNLGVHGIRGTLQTPSGTLEVTGVISHALAMVRRARVKELAIIGGARTIRSRAYADALHASGGIEVRSRIAQPLSAHVERGHLDTPVLHRDLDEILRPLHDAPSLLLACTHYAAIADHIQARLPSTQLFDPVDALTSWVLAHWRLERSARAGTFLTSGDPLAMRSAARAAFGIHVTRPRRVVLG